MSLGPRLVVRFVTYRSVCVSERTWSRRGRSVSTFNGNLNGFFNAPRVAHVHREEREVPVFSVYFQCISFSVRYVSKSPSRTVDRSEPHSSTASTVRLSRTRSVRPTLERVSETQSNTTLTHHFQILTRIYRGRCEGRATDERDQVRVPAVSPSAAKRAQILDNKSKINNNNNNNNNNNKKKRKKRERERAGLCTLRREGDLLEALVEERLHRAYPQRTGRDLLYFIDWELGRFQPDSDE